MYEFPPVQPILRMEGISDLYTGSKLATEVRPLQASTPLRIQNKLTHPIMLTPLPIHQQV